ncbi:hypothetical protein K8I31_20225 [bacterium]|nr:hypothetical protein [bacterium]
MNWPNWTQIKQFAALGYLWPLLFWGWVFTMSMWIEWSPVNDPRALPSTLAYTGISFKGLRFEQLDATGGRIVVNAPTALFNQADKNFQLDSPELTWSKPADNESFSAKGDSGQFIVETNISALPSEFNRMELTGNASAQSGKTAVDADRLVFDNQLLLFEVLGRYSWSNNQVKSKAIDPDSELFFDPIQQKIGKDKNELINARKPKP